MRPRRHRPLSQRQQKVRALMRNLIELPTPHPCARRQHDSPAHSSIIQQLWKIRVLGTHVPITSVRLGFAPGWSALISTQWCASYGPHGDQPRRPGRERGPLRSLGFLRFPTRLKPKARPGRRRPGEHGRRAVHGAGGELLDEPSSGQREQAGPAQRGRAQHRGREREVG